MSPLENQISRIMGISPLESLDITTQISPRVMMTIMDGRMESRTAMTVRADGGRVTIRALRTEAAISLEGTIREA